MTRTATPRRRRWAWLALLAGLLLVAVFGVRSWHQWQYAQRLARGEVQVETVRGWMTLPYIAQVHGVAQADLRAALALPPAGHDERSLHEWFEAQGIDPVAGRAALEAVILRARGAPARPAAE